MDFESLYFLFWFIVFNKIQRNKSKVQNIKQQKQNAYNCEMAIWNGITETRKENIVVSSKKKQQNLLRSFAV